MTFQSDFHLSALLKSVAQAMTVAVFLAGALVLVGWAFDIGALKSLHSELVTMKANTAFAFMLAALSLWLQRSERPSPWARGIARLCAAIVALVGLLTLVEYLSDWNLHLDQLLFEEQPGAVETSIPGRMAHSTALNFVLFGCALLLLDVEITRGHRPTEFLILSAAFISLLGLIGYAYGIRSLYAISSHTSMALHTAVLFLLFCIAVLCMRPNAGLMSHATVQGPGGFLARRLLPAAIVIPFVIGWLRLKGEQAGLYDREFGVSIMVVSGIVWLVGLIAWTARSINRMDGKRKQAEDFLQKAHEELEFRVRHRTLELAKTNEELQEEITARRRAEEASREGERRLRAIIDTEPECVKILAGDGTLLLINPAGVAMIEADSAEEMIGQSVYPLVAPGHREAFQALVEWSYRGGKGALQFEMIGLKGTRRWLDTHTAPLRNERHEIIGVLGITRDISERKQAEEAYRESEERYRRLVDLSPDAIYINRGGKIVFINSAGVRLFGATSPEQIIGRSPLDFVHPDYHQVVVERIRRLLEMRQPAPLIEEKMVRLDGSTGDIEVTASPFTDHGETAILVVLRDITERKRLEEQLRQSQKMEAIGKLAGGIAHDFNNLLTVILGHSQLLLAALGREHPLLYQVEAIKSAGERTATLTNQLLAFSRKQMIQPRVLDLNQVVADMKRMLQPLIGEDIILATELAGDLWPIKSDLGQVEQVIMNLAVNARDAMVRGGTLTITTANVVLDDASVRHHVGAMPGAYVTLVVKDTGGGMDAETQSRIFEPFFTTKERGKGTGLGLSTVYGVVKQSHGFIEVISGPEQGTAFTIYFPRVEAASAAPRQEVAAPRQRTGSETILLVEDESLVRELVRCMLEGRGYTVLEAGHGEEAVRICETHGGSIDLLLSDVVMPGMNGRELARRAAAMRPELRVLLMSGYTDEVIGQREVLEAGMAFVRKPFAPDDLARKIREVLEA
ncbi:MAG TPA: PAS domain S-box protein [Nitrospiraceae bacterium]|jgi:PAS domain S-box-containing protein|nr:PAS domain S-box protein [Nitrospiraceae bacterium]